MDSTQQIDSRVLEMYEDFARRAEERKGLERSWLINMNYYNGNQYAEILPTGAISDYSRKYPWQLTSVYNHIAPIIEARLAKFNRINNGVTCVSASSDPRDELASRFANRLLKTVKENNNFRALVGEASFWAEVCGTAFYKICWSTDRGRVITSDGLREGDALITVCPPQEIYPDSLSARNISDCRSIIHAKAYPIEEIEEKWGVKIKTGKASIMARDSSRNEVEAQEKENYALVLERYSLPTQTRPKGRLLIVSGDKVLYDGNLPYETEIGSRRGFPFVKQISVPSPSSFFGTSLVERLIPVQRAYNEIKNRKHEFFNRMTAGVLLAEDGSVDIDNLEDEGIAPGKVIIYRQGCEKPEMLNLGSVPSEFGEEEDRLLKEFITVSGVSDFLVTGAFTGLEYSGTALNIIMEQSNSRLCVTTESIRTASKEVAEKVLRIYKQFATNAYLATIENACPGESEAFKESEISNTNIVFELDDGQINTVSDRRGLAKEIYEMNLLTDKDGIISEDSKKKLLGLLGCEGFAMNGNTDDLHRKKAIKENEEIGFKAPDVEKIDDHVIHIEEHTRFLLGNTAIGQGEKEVLKQHIDNHRNMLVGDEA